MVNIGPRSSDTTGKGRARKTSVMDGSTPSKLKLTFQVPTPSLNLFLMIIDGRNMLALFVITAVNQVYHVHCAEKVNSRKR